MVKVPSALSGRRKVAETMSGDKPLPTTIPSIKLREDDRNIFRDAFRAEMATIEGFERQTIDDICDRYLRDAFGGHNQAAYFNQIRDGYFLGRDWHWPWYEQWRKTFLQQGWWPINWPGFDKVAGDADPDRYAFSRYGALMAAVRDHAGAASTMRRFNDCGINEWQVVCALPQDQSVFDYALSLRPNLLPPVFPYGIATIRPVIPGLR
jgi:hypothetical protein